MNITNLVKAMPDLYTSRTALFMVGAPGSAKSSISRASCDQLAQLYGEEFGYVDAVLPTIDSVDIRGFVVPHKNEDGTATSYYTKSPIIQQIEDTGCDRGILMLDEFAQADTSTQKACAEIILDRKIGQYKLPEGWFVMMASNRSKDKAGVGKMMAHITNRVIVVETTLDVSSWSAWAIEQKMHPLALGFAKSHPGAVFTDSVPANPDKPFCTARSFTKAMEYLAIKAGVDADGHPNMDIPVDIVSSEIVNGFVGDGAGTEMMAYFKVADLLPTIDEMLKDPDGCKLPAGSELGAQYALVSLIAYHASNKTVDTLFKVVLRLTKELQVAATLDLLKKSGGSLLNSKALNSWISTHRTLVSASMG